jgi:hypothetical protein
VTRAVHCYNKPNPRRPPISPEKCASYHSSCSSDTSMSVVSLFSQCPKYLAHLHATTLPHWLMTKKKNECAKRRLDLEKLESISLIDEDQDRTLLCAFVCQGQALLCEYAYQGRSLVSRIKDISRCIVLCLTGVLTPRTHILETVMGCLESENIDRASAKFQ